MNQHDWFINSELDHFLSPARAQEVQATQRLNILMNIYDLRKFRKVLPDYGEKGIGEL